jgi:predicted phosphodiesterase
LQIKGNYDKGLTGPKSQKQLQDFIKILFQHGSYEQVTREPEHKSYKVEVHLVHTMRGSIKHYMKGSLKRTKSDKR